MDVLILHNKMFDRWELPRVVYSDLSPIKDSIEMFFKSNFNIRYKIMGLSSVSDKYDWPTELIRVTGKTGEIHKFVYLRIDSNFKRENIISKTYDMYDFVKYSELITKIKFKNHEKLLREVIDEFYVKKHSQIHK